MIRGMDGRAIVEFSNPELQAFADDHVFYEIDMFLRGVEAAVDGSLPTNVAIEVFTIHLRNLLDFFYPPANCHKDDVIARNFFSEPGKWTPTAETSLLIASHRRAHKEVAHLTTARHSDPTKKQWDIPAVHADLAPVVSEFAREAEIVRESFRSEAFQRLNQCAETVKQGGRAFGRRLQSELGIAGGVATGLRSPPSP